MNVHYFPNAPRTYSPMHMSAFVHYKGQVNHCFEHKCTALIKTTWRDSESRNCYYQLQLIKGLTPGSNFINFYEDQTEVGVRTFISHTSK